jgi:hypothetical protein
MYLYSLNDLEYIYSMGAPVYDAKTKTYAGMFDIRDILSCVNVAHREFDRLMSSGVEYSREPVGMDSDGHTMHYLKMQREGLDRALKLLYTTCREESNVTSLLHE